MDKVGSSRRRGPRSPNKSHCSGTTTLALQPNPIGHRESTKAGCLYAQNGTPVQCQKIPSPRADINLGLKLEVTLFLIYHKAGCCRWTQDDLSENQGLWRWCNEGSAETANVPSVYLDNSLPWVSFRSNSYRG